MERELQAMGLQLRSRSLRQLLRKAHGSIAMVMASPGSRLQMRRGRPMVYPEIDEKIV